MPETIWLQPGETGTLAFLLSGPSGAPLPGAMVSFAIFDDPAIPDAEAQGATLATTSAVTNARGRCEVRITAGVATLFRMRATSANATADAVVAVSAGDVGSVDVAPFFPAPAGARGAASATTIEILFFDNRTCLSIPPRSPPQPVRTMSSVPASGAVAPYEFVSTKVTHAIFGRAVDGRGRILALGCVDLPGPTLVAGGTVQIALPLIDSGPDPLGRFAVTSRLAIVPPLAAVSGLEATWRDLTDCPLDPAQRWLDCTIDALGPTSDADPLDCVPASVPGGDGALGDALGALRGTLLAGPDGMPTACRGPKTAGGGISADAQAQGLFGGPLPPALIHLEAAADDAAHLLDELKLRSTLEIRDGALGTYAVTHTLTEIGFVLPGATTDVTLLPLGLPVLSTLTTGTVDDDMLVIAEHGLTVRLGTAARAAFGTLSLVRRGLPGDAAGLVAAIAALAHSDDGVLAGCAALDAALCPRAGKPSGCLAAACAGGLDALATRLDASFDAVDGTSLDLYLQGQAPLLDTHGNGLADRLGDPAAQAGIWYVDLRPRGGRRTLEASWEAIRDGN
jgi:hypothetical protein